MIPLSDRKEAVELVNEAVSSGARKRPSCSALGLSLRTFQRWTRELDVQVDGRKNADRLAPGNKLSDEERQAVLDVCNSERFKSQPPSQIVPTLADEGCYLASESTFYRILKEDNQQHHRGRSKKPSKRKPTSHCATGPNQVWSWDITYMNSPIRGRYYYLYLVMDVYSRMIVAWEVHEQESAEHASEMIHKACLRHNISVLSRPLVLHSDNGSPMKGATMLSTLQRLGVETSFSRPRVSNDNPFSESLFRTLKYRPGYPSQAFEGLDASREWVHVFVHWYNQEHKHSGLKFQTPQDRHMGRSEETVIKRKQVYQTAKNAHPERWGKRTTRNWELPEVVWLNPERQEYQPLLNAAA